MYFCVFRNTFVFSFLFVFYSGTQAQPVQYYFGNIHAHSGYSDGNQDSLLSLCSTPFDDFNYAKNALCFDFLGISDHNHSGAGMQLADYSLGLAEADAANQDGSFVAMYGMEWGVISLGGHVIIYGYNQLIGWQSGNYNVYNASTDYEGLFRKVARTPGAFAYLAHPDTFDFDSLYHKPLNPTSDSAISGTAIRSGPAFSTNTTYSNPSFFSYEYFYKKALSKGYHLGAGLDHDNHNTTFGRSTSGRLAVLAPSLTRNNIMNAIRNMHFYSTDDCNTEVSFLLNSQIMGSSVESASDPVISVQVTDPDLENVSSIKIYYGIPGSGILPVLLTSNTGQTSLNYIHTLAMNDSVYYYAKIQQSDGNIMITSPVWFKKANPPLPAEAFGFRFEYTANELKLNWNFETEEEYSAFILEKSDASGNFYPVTEIPFFQNQKNYDFADKNPFPGESFYKLSIVNLSGSLKELGVLKATIDNADFILKLYPQPANEEITLNLYGPLLSDETYYFSLTNLLGKPVLNTEIRQFPVNISLKNLSSGGYYYRLYSGSTPISRGKIWKE
ncbi:MAG: T9SS type A sorting domain-containing protein [Bacteroidia bacterium]|nr:T9SS type A sorting domain-containing protein [Bacteroidia bacterium]